MHVYAVIAMYCSARCGGSLYVVNITPAAALASTNGM